MNGITCKVKPVYNGQSREPENVPFYIQVKIIFTIHQWEK